MSSVHDEHSRDCQRIMLANWRKGAWKETPISKAVYLTTSHANWPCPDGAMYDPENSLSLGIEFKPTTESKRGIQTGIGQSLTYLDKFSASYLIIPIKVEQFAISKYLKKIFEKEVRGKLPLGLIGYEPGQPFIVEMLVDIDNQLSFEPDTRRRLGQGRYWAKFVDSSPHLVYLALETSLNYKGVSENRKESVYRLFFDKYLFPKEHRETLTPFESEIDLWGKKKMKPFGKKINELNTLIREGQLDRESAIEELKQHTFYEGRPTLTRSSQNDNLYKSYRKNYFTFLDHLQLWDENARLTPLGRELFSIGKNKGHDSKEYFIRFAKLILKQGKHYHLLKDIDKYSKGLSFESGIKARQHVFNKFENEGLVKRNLNRAAVEGSTKLFSMQFQLWTKLGFCPRSDRYVPDYGFNFDWTKINGIMNS